MRLSEYLKRIQKEREKKNKKKASFIFRNYSRGKVLNNTGLFYKDFAKSNACLPQGDLAQLRQVSEMNVMYRDCTQSWVSQKYINSLVVGFLTERICLLQHRARWQEAQIRVISSKHGSPSGPSLQVHAEPRKMESSVKKMYLDWW